MPITHVPPSTRTITVNLTDGNLDSDARLARDYPHLYPRRPDPQPYRNAAGRTLDQAARFEGFVSSVKIGFTFGVLIYLFIAVLALLNLLK